MNFKKATGHLIYMLYQKELHTGQHRMRLLAAGTTGSVGGSWWMLG